MKAKWIFQLACIVALVAATLGSSQPVQAGVKDPPDHPGPYQAGFTFMFLTDTERTSPNTPEGGRPIPSYIFYPAELEGDDPRPPALYPNDPLGLWGGFSPDPSTWYESYGFDPAYHEVPPSDDGPFPLVIFSPGYPASAEWYYQMGARLASHGFVVVIFVNYGDGAMGEPTLSSEYWWVWTLIDRELDIKFGITEFLAMDEDPTSLLHGLINPDQIVVSGHSSGGYAALGVVVPGGDPWFCDAEPGTYPYPCIWIDYDPRIKATIPLDGGHGGLSYDMLTQIKIPHMTLNREWNTILEEFGGSEPSVFARGHSGIQGHPNYRVDISQAYHRNFTNGCGLIHMWYDIGWISPPEIFPGLVHDICYGDLDHAWEVMDLITMYMVAFLKVNIVGDPGYQYLLTPGYALANEPLIEFFVTEKQNGRPDKPDWPEYFTYFVHQPGSQTAQALKDPPKPKLERDFMVVQR